MPTPHCRTAVLVSFRFCSVLALTMALPCIPSSAVGATSPGEMSPEAEGHADRLALEAWLASLSPEQRRGADFWAAERSKPTPTPCTAITMSSQAWFLGCREAQRRLAVVDVRRRTETDYRKGWNTPVIEQAATLAEPATPPAPSSTPVVQPRQSNDQALSSAVGMTVAQVKSAYPSADCSGSFCEFDAGHAPQAYCPPAGSCTRLVLYIRNGMIVGYTADLEPTEWSKSLTVSTSVLGVPKRETVGSSSVGIRSEYWSWMMNDHSKLIYTRAYGVTVRSVPFNTYSISTEPPSGN